MEEKPPEKQLGSVAVDSQTGMEHYDTPKQTPQVPPVPDAPNTENITPNYGRKTTGESENLAGVPGEFMNLFEHDPSEVILMQATRHPVGVISIFMMGGAAALIILITYIFLLNEESILKLLGTHAPAATAIGGLVSLTLLAIVVGLSFLAALVYRKSRLILTNQKVVLVQYHSLISREVSQLNIGDVEDVNVSQATLLDRIFKTGKVTIETAGEQNNYTLTQVEKPYEFAQKTIQVHEGSIAEYGN